MSLYLRCISISSSFPTVSESPTVEALLVGHVIYQQNTHCSSVVRSRDCSESFLTCGVPYLQFHPLAVQVDRSNLEVNPDRGDETGGKTVLTETEQTA